MVLAFPVRYIFGHSRPTGNLSGMDGLQTGIVEEPVCAYILGHSIYHPDYDTFVRASEFAGGSLWSPHLGILHTSHFFLSFVYELGRRDVNVQMHLVYYYGNDPADVVAIFHSPNFFF